MINDPLPPSPEATAHAGPGDPEPHDNRVHETKPEPPFASTSFSPPPRLARLLARGAVITISLAPTALMIWVFAPDELKYELRKQIRWLPWAARYAAWWLKQEGW
jgi:hypothetical protein